ncbi:hypothetical protein AKJ37_01955 [candidate division MSBL1 archaeon SCGC-AAA259I09]|uniref:Uncharacterized protein n=3 Tax=candidate division MSBL1 TaxID=215777 RepID=A0A133UUM4_9EURY|nr:hypothetical protein AKJ62_03480 [candidate division MSBL1 archaeon SCGC-AAA259D14]KXA89537.1 hypothetical protein AKJ61_02650 [candidate division MSBL1 archaeon SCGC-AAA259B11]KXA97914.1 hypothetical protein AKJ37_01955 [candidate division MSBL1 archaeon SCGC-AAA259I09]
MSDRKISIFQKKKEDYDIHTVNGAYGGISPRGDFVINFFHEHRDIPEKEEIQIDEKGERESPEEEESYVRDFKVGISLSPEQALNIANWMIEHIEDYKEREEVEE